MSRRLQVVMTDTEYRAAARAAKRRGTPLSELVRKGLRRNVAEETEPSAEERLAAILRFARFSGPTGDIDQLLREIETGRDLG
ncbi:MAG: hypothetical protein HY791_29395 [Deltaproteobacteria bacterium]|nr:hypothetical protein [Deltaproteobacteria bacterium]